MTDFVSALEQNCRQYATEACWLSKQRNVWCTTTWRDAQLQWEHLGRWLIAQSVAAGDAVAIWAPTRAEWTVADVGSILAGAVVVPVYQNLPLDQAQFIIHEPQCQVLIMERVLAPDEMAQLVTQCPALRVVLGLWETTPIYPSLPRAVQVLSWSDMQRAPVASREALLVRQQLLHADSLVSIVYTSGTTGVPKGAELTLGNFCSEVDALAPVFDFPHGYRCLQFLPLAHIVARAVQFFLLLRGYVGVYAESIDRLAANLRETSPHFFVGVPRIFEKMQVALQQGIDAQPRWKRRLLGWAMGVGQERSKYRQQQRSLPWKIWVQWLIAAQLFRPLQKKLGGRLSCAVSGGAPLSGAVARFFHSCGLLVLEGYGLTETTAAITLNQRTAFHFGTVGLPLSVNQLKLADDGEILVKGPTVFRGYFRRPDETAAVLHDGWFATGDIGEWSRNGFLRITDRKKDLIKTAGGKYIAPQPIENQLKQHDWVADAMVYGEGRPYVTAMLLLEQGVVERWAREKIPGAPAWPVLLQQPAVLAQVQDLVERVNSRLASFETIKRFRIVTATFSVDGGELTPTLKIRRKVVAEKFQALFDELYMDGAASGGVYVQRQHAA